MEISSTAIEVAILLVGLGGQWAVVLYRLNRSDKDFEEQRKSFADETKNLWSEMNKVRNRQNEHDKEAAEVRLGIERQFSALAIQIADTSSKFDSIMGTCNEIKERLKSVEEKLP